MPQGDCHRVTARLHYLEWYACRRACCCTREGVCVAWYLGPWRGSGLTPKRPPSAQCIQYLLYGCRLQYLRLQAVVPAVAGCSTYGCRRCARSSRRHTRAYRPRSTTSSARLRYSSPPHCTPTTRSRSRASTASCGARRPRTTAPTRSGATATSDAAVAAPLVRPFVVCTLHSLG